MEKAFYILGTIYLVHKVGGIVAEAVGDGVHYYKSRMADIRGETKEKQKPRNPIGFAVEETKA